MLSEFGNVFYISLSRYVRPFSSDGRYLIWRSVAFHCSRVAFRLSSTCMYGPGHETGRDVFAMDAARYFRIRKDVRC